MSFKCCLIILFISIFSPLSFSKNCPSISVADALSVHNKKIIRLNESLSFLYEQQGEAREQLLYLNVGQQSMAILLRAEVAGDAVIDSISSFGAGATYSLLKSQIKLVSRCLADRASCEDGGVAGELYGITAANMAANALVKKLKVPNIPVDLNNLLIEAELLEETLSVNSAVMSAIQRSGKIEDKVKAQLERITAERDDLAEEWARCP